ncbi:hypothetical protein FOQG_12726 [Fusarium oxysporum f. sp. raphani 54005]|uniref:Uncharacterized protein n=2 Tax=Fusarium oxysporum f. sp. raphani TaxID=96318 RepID=X0CKH3_FUSOX|nr:hypothetical protein FOQG_12726 [Fusarium oxysporum f. sp. raphani 54005]
MSCQLVSPDAAVSKPQQVGGVCAQSFQRITSPDLSSVRFILKLDAATPLVDFDRFDAASRGAWGSLRLLQSCVRRPRWIAIGALTAIVLLTFEPFTQAVLAIRDKEVILDHREYNKVVQSSNGSLETHGNVPTIGRSTRLDGASWTGAFAGVGVVQFPGPNNTPMNFHSIAPHVTSRKIWCRGISGYVTKSSGPVKLPSGVQAAGPYHQSWVLGHGETLPDVSNPSPYFDWANGRNFTFLKHEISELNISISNYNGSRHCRDLSQQCPDTYLCARVTTNPGQTLTFGNLSTIVMAIQYLVSNETWLDDKTTWEDTNVGARECALSLCVNEYHDVLSQGVLQEAVASSWTDREPGSYTNDDKNVKAFIKYTNHSLDMGILLVDLSDLQIKILDRDYKRQASALRKQYFNITQTTIIALQNVLSDGFGGIRDLKSPYRDYVDGISKKLLYPALEMNQSTAGFLSGLGRSSDIPATLDNVALSLTKWIRDRELEVSPMVGNATSMVIVTRLRWNYLWFPGASLITGMMFAVLCMWETQKLKKPALKDSILATLACAPDEDLRLCLKQAAATERLQEVGRKLEVRWEEDGEFGQLKEKKDNQPTV